MYYFWHSAIHKEHILSPLKFVFLIPPTEKRKGEKKKYYLAVNSTNSKLQNLTFMHYLETKRTFFCNVLIDFD